MMHHPYDTGEPSTDRRVLLGPPGDGSGPSTLTAGRDDPLLQGDPPELRPFNQPTTWNEGRTLHRLLPEDTEAFIPIVEKRLELNRALLVQLPAQIAEQERIVDEFQGQLDAAYERVMRLVVEDHRVVTERAPKVSGLIITSTPVVAPEVWLASRGTLLRDTNEWRAYETLQVRRGGSMSPLTRAKQEKRRLEDQLAEERINTGLLESRLYHLRANLEYWARQEA